MLWGIFNSILSGLGTISWKKSLEISTVTAAYFNFLDTPISLLICGIYLALGKVNFSIPLSAYAIVVLLSLGVLLSTSMRQRIYQEEKISALLPFQNLSAVITIVIAYIIFRDSSFVSFLVAIATILLIFGFSFDFRTLSFPKNILLVFSWNLLGSIRSLLLAYIIVRISSVGYFVLSSFFLTALFLFPLIRNKGWHEISKGKKEFYVFRLASSVVGQVSVFVGFFLLEKLGLITSTLLGFLSLGTIIFFGYFILHDTPKKKDIVLALLVSFLVFLGIYFK